MMTTPELVSLAVVVLAIAWLLTMILIAWRNRRQLDALMARVDQLEESIMLGASDRVDEPSSPVLASQVESGDVLAGWTSRVNHILTKEAVPRNLVDQALIGIYNRIEDPIQPSDLAEELCVSLRSLERGLARALDCTPGQLILTVKMREARRMIFTGQFRVGEVAHHLAFADASHFSRRYRRFYRCPPSWHLSQVTAGQ